MDKEGYISSEKSSGRCCLKGRWLRGQSGLGGEGSVTVRDCCSLRGDVCFPPCPTEQLRMSVCECICGVCGKSCSPGSVNLCVFISTVCAVCVYACKYV